MSLAFRGLALVLASVLGGCVGTVYEGRYSFSEGWREGRVLQVGAQLADDRLVFDCRKKIGVGPPEQMYAEISYQMAPRRRGRQIVPVRTLESVAPGDLVYTKMWDCGAPLFKRALR